jgi:hypothetical protein
MPRVARSRIICPSWSDAGLGPAPDEQPQDGGDNNHPEDWVDDDAEDGRYDDDDNGHEDIYEHASLYSQRKRG